MEGNLLISRTPVVSKFHCFSLQFSIFHNPGSFPVRKSGLRRLGLLRVVNHAFILKHFECTLENIQ